MPCPSCTRRELDAEPPGTEGPVTVRCAACGASFDALAEVTVLEDRAKLHGTCCAGWKRHDLRWRIEDAGDEGRTGFQVWAQDHVLLGRGDLVSLLFVAGDLARRATRRRPLMPLLVANHTRRDMWALAGCAPVATFR